MDHIKGHEPKNQEVVEIKSTSRIEFDEQKVDLWTKIQSFGVLLIGIGSVAVGVSCLWVIAFPVAP